MKDTDAADGHDEHSGKIISIIDRIDGFIYRARCDSDFTAIFIGGPIERITGYSQNYFLGDDPKGLGILIHPDDLTYVSAVIENAVARREVWNVDYRLLSKDGGVIWINEIGAAVADDFGEIQFIEGACLIIDSKKLIETENARIVGGAVRISEDIVKSTQSILHLLKRLNMIAVNARIAAAQAGSSGAAFAVVATEIRDLAKESELLARTIGSATSELKDILNIGK